MVKLNKIYTRTGDDGTTSLVVGPRRLKSDARIDAYGTIDEANAVLGLAVLHCHDQAELKSMLVRIQNDLFDLGADLATPDTGEATAWEPLRIIDGQVQWLENQIDRLNGTIEPLNSFILPGGSPLSAHLHLARTVVRRAERIMVELMSGEHINPAAIKYANRLSDFLFVAARHANNGGKSDILWVPGKNR